MIPLMKTPSKLPAPPIDATPAPRFRSLRRLSRSAPISVPSCRISRRSRRRQPTRSTRRPPPAAEERAPEPRSPAREPAARIASLFPLRPLADDLESVFNPITGSRAIHPAHLELMALWGLLAAVFALLAFRWEPDRRDRSDRGSRRPAVFAADRVRGLLAPRVQRESRSWRGEGPRPQSRVSHAAPTVARPRLAPSGSRVPPQRRTRASRWRPLPFRHRRRRRAGLAERPDA